MESVISDSVFVNSLRPSDAIWRWRSWSTLVQVMAYCLTAPCHYLNQCWIIIREVPWHSSGCIIMEDLKKPINKTRLKIAILKWHSGLPGANEFSVFSRILNVPTVVVYHPTLGVLTPQMTVCETMCIISNFTREYVILYIWNDFIINCYWILLVVVFVICKYCHHQWAFPSTRGQFYEHDLTFIRAWMSNHIPIKVWNKITYPFPNFNCVTVAVWKWISNFIPHFIMDGMTYPCWDWN